MLLREAHDNLEDNFSTISISNSDYEDHYWNGEGEKIKDTTRIIRYYYSILLDSRGLWLSIDQLFPAFGRWFCLSI
jgi:hypothetical protein